MAFDFTGKKYLVTGAGRGIGRDLCLALAKAGAEVYGLSRQKERLDSLVAEFPSIHPIQVDLADWEATRREADKLPVLDGLVNNAAISFGWLPSLTVSKDVVEKTINVNVMAALNLIQACGKKMIDAGKSGSIVNVSSINGIRPMRECLAYDMSKAALDMMTRQFALELGPHKIRVNSVQPTVVFTDMGKINWGKGPQAAKLRDHTPLGRFAEVDEIVGPVMYLLSDYSSMVTGTMNPVEGGVLSNISV